MIFDFAFILLALTALAGAILLVEALWLKPHRMRSSVAALGGHTPQEPLLVDYARSFFPVLLIVLVVRSFIFEPFRIPSDSMMPTLLHGDFIFVNKYTYGLRLPAFNTKVVPVGSPQRGDVVVFRFPGDPSINYIKRLIGLPGDHILVRDERVFVNGQPMAVALTGSYAGPGYEGAQLASETLGEVKHQILLLPGRPGPDFEATIPPGHYFFMGDNRDNSHDSRFADVGFVPEENLVGRATLIWLNWDFFSAMPIWDRIGTRIR